MARPAAGQARTLPIVAFRYAPGDGHVYTWDGTTGWVRVFRIVSRDPLLVVDTGTTVDMTGCARTATALSERVDQWRGVK